MSDQDRHGVDRRTFLLTTAGAFALSFSAPRAISVSDPAAAPGSTLYNGIRLAQPWPPRYQGLSPTPLTPPYLVDRPGVVPIDLGRQLFVDDFLIDAPPDSLLALADHPRIEIRIYNPQSSVGVSFLDWLWNVLTDFRGVNQRMHDKTLIVDGEVGRVDVPLAQAVQGG